MLSFLKRAFGRSTSEKANESVVEPPDGSMSFYPSGTEPPSVVSTDRLAKLARDATNRCEFIRALADDGLFLLTSVPRENPKEVRFLGYREGSRGIFPIFSSQDRATAFVETLRITEYTTFQCLGLKAKWLLENNWQDMTLLMNPKSEFETEITADDLELLRSMTSC